MTRGFFDYEGKDDDEPRTHYGSRVSKAKKEGTWTKPGEAGPNRPRGAATATAAQSFWLAITWSVLAVPRLVLTVLDNADDWRAIDSLNIGLGVVMLALVVTYWNSWRILRPYEAEHGKPEGQEKSDRRIRRAAVAIVTLVVIGIVVLAILQAVGVIT